MIERLKNISPKNLSLLNAGILAVLLTLSAVVLFLPFHCYIIIFIVVFALSFFLYNYTTNQFINRKIKLIYKMIFQTKATKREEFFNKHILPHKSIDEVQEEVMKWANEKKKEIAVLKQNEAYRKEFLLNISHELKTPIFSIQGYLHNLLDGAQEEPELRERFLRNASKSVERLVLLVRDLDQITDLESGAVSFSETGFCVQKLVKEVFEELEILAQAKNIKFQIKKGTESPIYAKADKDKIKQVCVNLIENAIKYGKEGGSVSAGFYSLDEQTVYVEISDDGPGIAEEHLPRLFERFYRVDKSRSQIIKGSGLGLAIVKHIVEAHGQTVNVRSKKDVGTSFGFTLDKSPKELLVHV